MPSDVIRCPKSIGIKWGRQKGKSRSIQKRGENAKEKRAESEERGADGTGPCRAEEAEAPCFFRGHFIFLERLPAGWGWYPESMRL
ncbi:MAG: hypothetical protein ACLTWD_09745 [Bacteroides uniformis]|jgi:hypothetical protein